MFLTSFAISLFAQLLTVSRLGYAVDGKQTVSAMKYAARHQPFVKKVGQQPVAEILRLIVILQSIFDQPCRLIAGVPRNITLP